MFYQIPKGSSFQLMILTSRHHRFANTWFIDVGHDRNSQYSYTWSPPLSSRQNSFWASSLLHKALLKAFSLKGKANKSRIHLSLITSLTYGFFSYSVIKDSIYLRKWKLCTEIHCTQTAALPPTSPWLTSLLKSQEGKTKALSIFCIILVMWFTWAHSPKFLSRYIFYLH